MQGLVWIPWTVQALPAGASLQLIQLVLRSNRPCPALHAPSLRRRAERVPPDAPEERGSQLRRDVRL